MKKLKLLIFLFIIASCSENNSQSYPKELLYVWLHDVGFEDPNFLAVINADAESEKYGELIDTVPVYKTTGMAHHTPIFLPTSGLIYANDFHNSHTYIYDASDPQNPRLLKSFGKTKGYSFPHSYSELPNGNIISTFQTKGGIDTVGGIVEFTADGEYLRSSDAEIDESIFMRPYGIVLVPKLNRIITTNYDMHETDNGYHIQVWNMETLENLHTIRLPKTKNMIIDQNPFEGRLLLDGETVMFQTFSCGLYVLSDIDKSKPKISYVHHFAEGPFCSLPVRLSNFWIQTVASDTGGFNGVVVLDIKDPFNPIEVDRLDTGVDYGTHWLSPNRKGNKIVLTGFFKELERRVMVLDFDKNSGKIAIDQSFRDRGINEPGFMLDREVWPHGETGLSMAHGAIYWPAAEPDWKSTE